MAKFYSNKDGEKIAGDSWDELFSPDYFLVGFFDLNGGVVIKDLSAEGEYEEWVTNPLYTVTEFRRYPKDYVFKR